MFEVLDHAITSSQNRMFEVLGQAKTQQHENGLLLDIGANIGWFTLNAAAAGHQVVAFEPFAQQGRGVGRG